MDRCYATYGREKTVNDTVTPRSCLEISLKDKPGNQDQRLSQELPNSPDKNQKFENLKNHLYLKIYVANN